MRIKNSCAKQISTRSKNSVMDWLDQEDWNAWPGRKPGQIAEEQAA